MEPALRIRLLCSRPRSLLEPLPSSPPLRPSDTPPLIPSLCFLSFANSFSPPSSPKASDTGNPPTPERHHQRLGTPFICGQFEMGLEVNGETNIRQQLVSVLSWSVLPTPPPPRFSGYRAQHLTPTSQPRTDATESLGFCSAFLLSVTLTLLLLGRKSLQFAWLSQSHSYSVPFLTPLELRHLAVSKLSNQFMFLS